MFIFVLCCSLNTKYLSCRAIFQATNNFSFQLFFRINFRVKECLMQILRANVMCVESTSENVKEFPISEEKCCCLKFLLKLSAGMTRWNEKCVSWMWEWNRKKILHSKIHEAARTETLYKFNESVSKYIQALTSIDDSLISSSLSPGAFLLLLRD